MFQAANVFSSNPDPDAKLGDLKTLEIDKLYILLNRYKKIIENRRLLSRLKDGGESARRILATVEAELERRQSSGDGPGRQQDQAAQVQQLADRLQQMEWTSATRQLQNGGGETEPLDSDDDPNPEPVNNPTSHQKICDKHDMDGAPTDHASGPIKRQMLAKSATSRRCTRFQTNRTRRPHNLPPPPPLEDSASDPVPSVPCPAERGGGIVRRWVDSVLAPPARPDAATQLLDMQESLQLLSGHEQQLQMERMGRLMSRALHVTGDHDSETTSDDDALAAADDVLAADEDVAGDEYGDER